MNLFVPSGVNKFHMFFAWKISSPEPPKSSKQSSSFLFML